LSSPVQMNPYKASLVGLRGLLLLLAFVISALAQSQQDESQSPRTAGVITGTVVNESGQPLVGAVVSVRAYGALGQGRIATTDTEGRFKVSGLDPLTYIVSASYPTYVPTPRDPDSTQAPYYRVGDSVRIQLMRGGVITGSVTTPTGDPLVAVRVQAAMIRDAAGKPLRYGPSFRDRLTDDRGIYRIYGLSPGTYVVLAGGAGGFPDMNSAVYETASPTFAPSSTRDTAMEINLQPGVEVSNIDIRYRAEPGHVISGTAIDPSSAAPGFGIYLTPIYNGEPQWPIFSYQQPGSRGYSFFGVSDGDYDITAQASYPTGDVALSEPRRVRVAGADVTGIDVTVKLLGSISGHITLEDSKAPECQGKRRPLLGETLISPWHNDKNSSKDQPQFGWALGSPTLPDNQGDFVLRNLAPGQYRFHTKPFAKYWYLKSILLKSAGAAAAKATSTRTVDAARNWTAVGSGVRVSGLTITLAAGAASLKGQIKLAEGQKMPAKPFVYLVPAEPEKAEDILRYFASPVEPDGTFMLSNLPPGRYWTLAKALPETESAVLSKLRLPDETEARNKLRQEASLARTETEFKPCQNITGYSLPLK
jgi:protocatechuate 3,4-dioxygenase beta subunit